MTNAWDKEEKELKEEIKHAINTNNVSKEVHLHGKFIEFQKCRQMHEAELNSLFEEINEIIKNMCETENPLSKHLIDREVLLNHIRKLKSQKLGKGDEDV